MEPDRHGLAAGPHHVLSCVLDGLAAFKTEMEAIAWPPLFFFTRRSRISGRCRSGSITSATHGTASRLLSARRLCRSCLGRPPPMQWRSFPSRRTRGTLLWILSNKFMPAVGVLVPIYLMLVWVGWLDTLKALIILNLFANLPIVVWMLYSYFKEIPPEIIEAVAHGRRTALPAGSPASSAARCPGSRVHRHAGHHPVVERVVLVHQSSRATQSGTLALAIASFSNPEGFFWAKLSAVSLASIAPDHGVRLGHAAPTRPRPDLRCGQIGQLREEQCIFRNTGSMDRPPLSLAAGAASGLRRPRLCSKLGASVIISDHDPAHSRDRPGGAQGQRL